MKRTHCFKIVFTLALILLIASISFAGNPKAKPFIPDISQTWTEITPEPTEFMGRWLGPTCSGAPGTDSTFKFFAKGGPVNNLVIFFDGGGACWDTMNCIYAKTYSPEVDETLEDESLFTGIFDLENPDNPFKDWNFVFIPYCTGDIHWGSAETTYIGYQGEGTYTIQHKGFDNFLVVLKWITEHFEKPHKIFVTGSSAGSYGALIGFPYIQEAFPNSMASMLGDAGFGVIPEYFQNVQMYNWGFIENLPYWIPGFERPFSEYSISEMYKMIGQYYPHRKIGQFTTAWDETQIFFYNVMLNTWNPENWGEVDILVAMDWNEQMLDYARLAAETPNYRYYIAAGSYHTILPYQEFYTEDSTGVAFIDWLKAMVENQGGTNGQGAVPWFNLENLDYETEVDNIN